MGCRGVPEGHRWYYGFGFSGDGGIGESQDRGGEWPSDFGKSS